MISGATKELAIGAVTWHRIVIRWSGKSSQTRLSTKNLHSMRSFSDSGMSGSRNASSPHSTSIGVHGNGR